MALTLIHPPQRLTTMKRLKALSVKDQHVHYEKPPSSDKDTG